MKYIQAVLLSVLISTSALAQQQVTTPKDVAATGTLTTITTDKVSVPILGSQWATVQFMATAAGTSTVTAQVSTDNGTNYSAASYARRLSSVTANPTVQPITATTLGVSDIWEVTLAANVTNFQLLCAATGTTTSVVIRGGVPYVPGMVVVGVLYDQTSATNTALDTGTLDTSGWTAVAAHFTMNGGAPSFTAAAVDDLGVTEVTYSTTTTAGIVSTGLGWTHLPKRSRYQSAAIAAQTSRIRLEARR